MRYLLLLLILLPCIALPAFADDKMPPTIQADNHELLLNGSGLRKKAILKVYNASLYLKEHSADHKRIIEADEAMAIRLHIRTNLIKSQDFIEATQAGFERATNGQLDALQPRINLMYKVFEAKIKDDDTYDMIYQPGKGIHFFKNGIHETTIEGLDMKQALFGVWLVENPAHGCPELRNGMLGL